MLFNFQAIGDNNECITSPNLSNRECLSSTPPVEHLLQAHYAETFYQTLVDMAPVVGSPTEEQSIGLLLMISSFRDFVELHIICILYYFLQSMLKKHLK